MIILFKITSITGQKNWKINIEQQHIKQTNKTEVWKDRSLKLPSSHGSRMAALKNAACMVKHFRETSLPFLFIDTVTMPKEQLGIYTIVANAHWNCYQKSLLWRSYDPTRQDLKEKTKEI